MPLSVTSMNADEGTYRHIPGARAGPARHFKSSKRFCPGYRWLKEETRGTLTGDVKSPIESKFRAPIP